MNTPGLGDIVGGGRRSRHKALDGLDGEGEDQLFPGVLRFVYEVRRIVKCIYRNGGGAFDVIDRTIYMQPLAEGFVDSLVGNIHHFGLNVRRAFRDFEIRHHHVDEDGVLVQRHRRRRVGGLDVLKDGRKAFLDGRGVAGEEVTALLVPRRPVGVGAVPVDVFLYCTPRIILWELFLRITNILVAYIVRCGVCLIGESGNFPRIFFVESFLW